MSLDIGILLHNRYRIHSIIAQGGMGAIYRAMDENLGVEVAVKENLFTDSVYSRQFHLEATILAGLRHPNLPRVTDHFAFDDQGQYLVMDYIEGEDLRQRMSRMSGIAEAEAILIGIAISNALDYLHSRQPPILHRDIKPGNIKLTSRGQIFLVDFGLAKIVRSGQVTTIGAQSLTPGYAPPEQYGQGTDTRSDIYSLSATLYAALTNAVPEDGLARAMGSATLTPLRQRKPQVSERAAAVIERGMSILPEQRHQSAGEFKQALMGANTQIRQRVENVDEVLLDQTRSTLPPAVPQPVVEPTQRHSPSRPQAPEVLPPPQPGLVRKPARRGLLAGVFALLLVVVAGILIVPGMLRGKKSIAPPTQTQPAPAASITQPSKPLVVSFSASPSPTLTETISTPVVQPTQTTPTVTAAAPTPEPEPSLVETSPDQFAFVSNRSGVFQIYVMDAGGKNLRQVTKLTDGACQPDWSPDGKRLVFVSPCRKDQDQYKGSALFTINADGTGVIPLRTTPGGDYEPAWSPLGDQIAFTTVRDGRPHIYLYNLGNQTAANLSTISSVDRQPAWSPDGKAIAFTSLRSNDFQVYIMDPDGKNAHPFSNQGTGPSQSPAWSPDGQIIVFSRGNTQPWLVAKRLNDRINEFPVSETVRPARHPSYSPDGNWLIFSSTQDGNPEIYRMTPNGSELTRLTEDPGVDIDPVWKPNKK